MHYHPAVQSGGNDPAIPVKYYLTKTMTKTILVTLVLALPSVVSAQSTSKTYRFDSVGLRGGIDSQGDININTAELFATVTTPYQFQLGDTTVLDFNLEGGVGALDHKAGTGFYLRIGPQCTVSFGDSPLHLVIGSGPAYLSKHTFGRRNLGGDFQFFTSMGFDWDINDRWTLGYRWQHISNAGLQDVNPGMNMHTLGLSYRF